MVAINVLGTFRRGRDPVEAEHHERVEGKYVIPHSEFQRKSQKRMSLPIVIVGGLAGFSLMTFIGRGNAVYVYSQNTGATTGPPTS